jgi:hypothetical protein
MIFLLFGWVRNRIRIRILFGSYMNLSPDNALLQNNLLSPFDHQSCGSERIFF